MIDLSLLDEQAIIKLVVFIFAASLCFGFALGIIESWTEIPGVNEPNTYGAKEKEEGNINTMLLSNSIHSR